MRLLDDDDGGGVGELDDDAAETVDSLRFSRLLRDSGEVGDRPRLLDRAERDEVANSLFVRSSPTCKPSVRTDENAVLWLVRLGSDGNDEAVTSSSSIDCSPSPRSSSGDGSDGRADVDSGMRRTDDGDMRSCFTTGDVYSCGSNALLPPR